MTGWEAADRELLVRLDGALELAARRAGSHLACRPGCIECCIGPFPITALDAWRLRRAFGELEARDPSRAEAIRRRAEMAAALMRADFPGDPQTGILAGEAEAAERFFERHAALPCPLLDPATGLCELYEARPLSCRTFGLPVRIGSEDLPPCRLCFRQASAAEIEACRVVIDPEGIEDRLLAEAEDAESVIAFALIGIFAPEPRLGS
ncbi:MAG: YkgJ family cysteine cluster protein [Bryobacterales bacterium]|nr:YkgJ family cysteine cluster protein [Bryobacteraceae bacterium]MDW8130716.1 YkgJ family cysteine cluster protein [Bryobacterales bacterium]